MAKRKIARTARLQGRHLLRRLPTRFPALFPADLENIKPWAVGEGHRMRQALADAEDGERVSVQVWRSAMNQWFYGDVKRRIAYLERLTEGAPRYDLHGDVSGQVSSQEAAQAAAELPARQRQLTWMKRTERPCRSSSSGRALPDSATGVGGATRRGVGEAVSARTLERRRVLRS